MSNVKIRCYESRKAEFGNGNGWIKVRTSKTIWNWLRVDIIYVGSERK